MTACCPFGEMAKSSRAGCDQARCDKGPVGETVGGNLALLSRSANYHEKEVIAWVHRC